MEKDTKRLNALIELSNTDLKQLPDEYWFSWANQRILTYNLAARLLIEDDLSPDQAVSIAKEFMSEFYYQVMRKDNETTR